MKAESRDGKMNADSKGAANSKSSTTTTGQAAAGGKLSTEQRTQITTVIKQQNVRPVTNVNFSISVGTRGAAQRRLPPAAGANRHDLSGLARLRVLPGRVTRSSW